MIVVGPEGGLAPAEVTRAQAAGAIAISLGTRILRTETAALVVVAALLYARAEL
jgi:16S rRNA (uracil1498-N3)-methyltransferase